MPYINIDIERVRHKWSYENFAAQMGVSRKTIYNWLSSGNIPTDKLIHMATLFDCSIDYLLGLSDIKRREKEVEHGY